MSLEPGKVVSTNLRLVRLLGRGAMGSVWVADHLTLQAQVAVKFMAPAMMEDEVSVKRFQQEAKAAAQIKSPHVVQVFDHGTTDDGYHYIVMELLEGQSVRQRCKAEGALRLREVSNLVSQACKGLAMAHAKGIIHRDIKPANVFISDVDGQPFVKVLDFGVAKFSHEEALQMTAQGNMVGTPAYMSPEQFFADKPVTHKADLWATAVVAYYALTGERPFAGKTLGELCVNIRRAEFQPPSAHRSDLGPEVDAWFAKALNEDPDERFDTAKQMATALEHVAGLPNSMESTPSAIASSPQLITVPGTNVSSHPGIPIPVVVKKPSYGLMAVAGGALLAAVAVAAFYVGGSTAPPAPAPAATPPTPAAATSADRDAKDDDVKDDDVKDDDEDDDEGDDDDDDDDDDASAAASASASAKPAAQPAFPRGAPVKGPVPGWKPPKSDDRAQRAGEALGL